MRVPPPLVWGLAVAAAILGAWAPAPWWQLGIAVAAVLACAASGRLSAPALRWGLSGALLFIVLRLVYRVLFASAVAPPAGATVLLDLPTIPLGGPFAGIALLGPLTLAQLAAALADASRFAVVFVVFGAANALADARSLLARAPGPLRPVATVLALALGTVPALLTATERVARSALLRGERRGPQLLVPVFEQAVERATTLGASMALRGYGAAVPGAVAPSTASPGPDGALLRVRGLGVRHDDRTVFAGVSLVLRAGELTIVAGPTGSGKSTLLAALAGLAPAYTGGEVSGSVVRQARVGLLPQRVDHSFVAETVREELAFAPRRRGLDEAAVERVVERTAARFALRPLLGRAPATLSAGEATRVAFAAVVASGSRVLLLDEPVADLDPVSATTVLDALRGLLAEGCAVLVAEHRVEALEEAGLGEAPIRRFAFGDDGRLLPVTSGRDAPVPPTGFRAAPLTVSAAPRARRLLAQGLLVARGGRPLLRVPELFVIAGEVVVLRGPNGSGKTSLLEDIALPPGSRRRAPGVRLVPHRVDDLLIRDTLADECRHADRRAGAPRGSTARCLEELLAGSAPAVVRAPRTHPRDLSAGTRLALAIAVQLPRPDDGSVSEADAPPVLLLDEPTRGLDRPARERLAALLAGYAASGAAVLLATHDDEFAGLLRGVGIAVRELRVEGERLVSVPAASTGSAS